MYAWYGEPELTELVKWILARYPQQGAAEGVFVFPDNRNNQTEILHFGAGLEQLRYRNRIRFTIS